MSTTLVKPAEVARKWYILDAADKPLGRVAAQAAHLLRGKHKTSFTPNVDCGDFVIVINAEKAILTGKKLDQKFLRWHTGWIGHLKEVSYRDLMEKNPEKAVSVAVKGMLPGNVLGRKQIGRLHVYRGSEHVHQAQKPEICEF